MCCAVIIPIRVNGDCEICFLSMYGGFSVLIMGFNKSTALKRGSAFKAKSTAKKAFTIGLAVQRLLTCLVLESFANHWLVSKK
jgi:hypothetical protein